MSGDWEDLPRRVAELRSRQWKLLEAWQRLRGAAPFMSVVDAAQRLGDLERQMDAISDEIRELVERFRESAG